MANPERTPYGTWRSRWRDESGRQRAKSFKRKGDAERFLHATVADIDRGVYVASSKSKLTVAAWADEWLAGARNLRQGGKSAYRADVDRHILPAIGEIPIGKLTDTDLDKMLADLSTRLGPGSVAKIYRTLRRMLNVAVKRHKLAVSPLAPVEAPRVPPTEMRFLSAAEVERLADAMDERYRTWVRVAAYGGLRWSETAGLRPERVDLERCRVHVVEQLINGRREEPKSDASRRWVSLPTSMRDELKAHLATHSTDLVFPAPRGGPLGTSFRNRFWLPACLAAGLATLEERPGLPPRIVGAPRIHDLRHTAVALAIATGAHPKAIQMRMGHSSIVVTLDRYGHLFDEMDSNIVDGLDAMRG